MGFADLPPLLTVVVPHTPSELPQSMPEQGLPFRKACQNRTLRRKMNPYFLDL